MSNCTQESYRPVARPVTKTVMGADVLDLTSMLGAGGCKLFETELQCPESGWVKQNTARVNITYQRTLEGELPAGVSNASVAIHLIGGIAEVTRRWTYESTVIETEASIVVPEEVTAAMAKSVSRAVNAIIVTGVANRMRQQMEQGVAFAQRERLAYTLETRQRARNQVQLRMQLRQGAGR